ncbi:hypothetical protein JOF56_005198 [Kibdelosporangium banguiense]|uniref:Uncharacterized protein n=1 Tax=Kibdelosporangium banguiense TaxID=1365924 RepID=A0ABS4TK64_9PSEU|nr:hypothetical protein [Kibdelosporangium banguiense]MBP2324813.1 hypothetical protein [Kibdelosporangium banguiense]
MSDSKVTVVDLRDLTGDPPSDLVGGLLVVDHAGCLVEHAETYLSLLSESMVTAVVCVAVGEIDTGNPLDGVVLDLPPALWRATVLWVGDHHGIDWAPDSSSPRPAGHSGDTLDSMIAALQVSELFDHVVAAADELSGPAVNPGIRLVSSAADPAELAEARAAAVRSLCVGGTSSPHDLETLIRQSYARTGEGSTLSGRVQAAGTEAVQRIDHVRELARELATPKALFGPNRAGRQLGKQVGWAGQAAENHRRVVAEVLNRMDGHLQVGHPSVADVTELGAPEPRTADSGEIAENLRAEVDTLLDQGVALSTLAQELRHVAANTAPQGCTAALDEVRAKGPLSLGMPAFPRWPLRPALLPLIFLSCAAVAFLLAPGWLSGGVLAVLWFLSGWVLLGRRPDAEDEAGLGATVVPALLTYGLAGLSGTAVGVVAGLLLEGQFTAPPPVGQLVAVVAVLLTVTAATVSWRSATQSWRDGLRVNEIRVAVDELTRLAEETAVREWLPMRHRQIVSAAAAEVAGGLEEIAATLEEAGNRLFAASRPSAATAGAARMARPVPHELYAVVRGDLLDVCRTALDPAWPAAEAALRTAQGVYARRLDRLLGEYGVEVRQHGLLAANRFSRSHGPRDDLTALVWSQSPAALAALRTDVDGDMTQLCRSSQLGYLSRTAEPGLLRFAPAQLRRVLEQDGLRNELVSDLGIVWSDGGEYVGALRLVPLRPESVRQVLGGVQ